MVDARENLVRETKKVNVLNASQKMESSLRFRMVHVLAPVQEDTDSKVKFVRKFNNY